MKRTKRSDNVLAALIISLIFVGFFAPRITFAQQAAEPEVVMDASSTMKDNLNSLIGKTVYLNLRSGKSLVGVVKKIGGQMVLMEEVGSRSYLDALVRIDDISVVEVKARN